jgi:hypothetical protein
MVGLLKNLDVDKDGYVTVYDQPFTAIPKNVGFNNGLRTPKLGIAE